VMRQNEGVVPIQDSHSANPGQPTDNHVRLTDICPQSSPGPPCWSLERTVPDRLKVLSWISISLVACPVRTAVKVAKSQLGMAALIALDTKLRNGHASVKLR